MVNEEKVECLKKIDLCNEGIRKFEKDLEAHNKYITQGSIGILLGIVSFILGWFFPVCFLGLVFGLAGVILLIVNIIQKRDTEANLASNRLSLSKWKEKLYRLES